MIKFNINQEHLNSEIEGVISGLKSIPQAQNIANISRAAASIAAVEAIKALNREAKANPKRYHHLYEWQGVGVDSARLVKAKRVVSGKNVGVEFILKKSKKNVPISKSMKSASSGQNVTRKSVFKNKAEVIENGRSIQWTAKRNVVFSDNNQLIFRKAGTVFKISNPGGAAAHGALQSFSKKWENGMAASAIDKSKIFKKLETDIAKTLSMKSVKTSDLRKCIKIVCDSYDIKNKEY